MTTPIIHPINETSRPVFPCRLWRMGASGWMKQVVPFRYDAYWSHWSPGIDGPEPLPPEVTPEQGKGETWIGEAANTPEKAERLVELFHGVKYVANGDEIDMDSTDTPPPASGPSPAALAAAKEILMMLYGSGTIANANADACAAIIDRKFPREEDGEVPQGAKWPAWMHYTKMVVMSWGTWKAMSEIERAAYKYAKPYDPDSARAALQDSREGK